MARPVLDFLEEVGLADGAGQSRRYMDVIGRAAHAVGLAMRIAAHGRQVGVHARADRGVSQGRRSRVLKAM
jgi:hypothetical protein